VTVAPPPGTITWPRGKWIPEIEQLTNSAAGLLAVVGEALDNYDIGAPFTRRIYTHGDVVPVQINEDPQSQLIVTWTDLELGNAGAKQFQFQMGDIGTAVHNVGAFKVQLWIPWPTPSGGFAPSLADDLELMEATAMLNRCMWVAFSALRALSLGGVKIYPPVTPLQIDGIIVGPATPLGPEGTMAGVEMAVQVSYD
jgi:hypothetical protein